MKHKPKAFAVRRPPAAALLVLALWALCLAAPVAAGAAGAEPSTWFIDMGRFADGAHGRMVCQQCHPEPFPGPNGKMRRPHPDPDGARYLTKPSRREYDFSHCMPCHRLAWERYHQGAHAEARAKQKVAPPAEGEKVSPTCAYCHNPHYEPAMSGRLALGRREVRVCGSCHQPQLRTYLASYHGKAAYNLGNGKAAFCTDCHGAHAVKSLKKPQDALAACKRCHLDAGPKFAQVVMHPTSRGADQEKDPALARRIAVIEALSVIMAVLVALMVGLFYGHSFLWLLRDLHHKLRKYGK